MAVKNPLMEKFRAVCTTKGLLGLKVLSLGNYGLRNLSLPKKDVSEVVYIMPGTGVLC